MSRLQQEALGNSAEPWNSLCSSQFGCSCSQKFLVSRAMLPQCRTIIPAHLPRLLHHIQMTSYFKINMSLNSVPIYWKPDLFIFWSTTIKGTKIPRKSLSIDGIHSMFDASFLSAGLLCSMGTGTTSDYGAGLLTHIASTPFNPVRN